MDKQIEVARSSFELGIKQHSNAIATNDPRYDRQYSQHLVNAYRHALTILSDEPQLVSQQPVPVLATLVPHLTEDRLVLNLIWLESGFNTVGVRFSNERIGFKHRYTDLQWDSEARDFYGVTARRDLAIPLVFAGEPTLDELSGPVIRFPMARDQMVDGLSVGLIAADGHETEMIRVYYRQGESDAEEGPAVE